MVRSSRDYPGIVTDAIQTDPELHLLVPKHPRLAAGCSLLEGTGGAALVYGGLNPEIIDGESVFSQIQQLAGRLDGLSPFEQVATRGVEGDRDLLSLLFMSGALRDGPLNDRDDALLAFADLRIGESAWYQNGADFLTTLQTQNVAVVCHDEVLGDLVVALLRRSGLARARTAGATTELQRDDYLIYICDTDRARADAFFADVEHRLSQAIWFEVGEHAVRLGPQIRIGITCSARCVIQQTKPLAEQDAPPLAPQLAAALITNFAVTAVGRLRGRPAHNHSVHVDLTDGLRSTLEPLGRLRDWSVHAAGTASHLNIDPRNEDDWKQFCNIALQSDDAAAPSAYLSHYRPRSLSAAVHVARNFPSRRPIDLAAITGRPAFAAFANLLETCFGFRHRDTVPIRTIPSGGNLGSPLMLIALDEPTSSAPVGLYSYCALRNALLFLEGGTLAELNGVLPRQTEHLRCVVLGDAGRVARKYGPLSRFIVNYDAGVLLSAWRLVSDALGLAAANKFIDLSTGPWMPGLLGEKDESLKPIAGFYYPYFSHLVPGRRINKANNVIDQLERRRAVRRWAIGPLDARGREAVLDLTRDAVAACLEAWPEEMGVEAFCLFRESDRLAVYAVTVLGSCEVLSVPSVLTPMFFAQRELNKAPVSIFPTFSLTGDGSPPANALEAGLRRCGYIVGRVWLRALAHGLVGTACGASLEGEIRGLLGRHDMSHIFSLGLVLGRPMEDWTALGEPL